MAKRKITVDEIKDAAEYVEKEMPAEPVYLSSGSTLLNLLLSDKYDGGYVTGGYVLAMGTSRSGKSLLTLQALAEAANSDTFADYTLYHDDSERGASDGLKNLFGNKTAERIKSPAYDENGVPQPSSQVEEFFFRIDDICDQGKPFIYVLDSFDSLTTDDEESKFDDLKKAHRAGKQISGTYGLSKAKAFSTYMRKIVGPIRDTNSILFGISQAKDNIGFGFEKHTRAGGTSLRYYATCEIMVDIVESIKKTVAGNPRHIGNRVKITANKNRQTGSRGAILISIYDSHGVDDLGDIVHYLAETENHWKRTGQKLVAPEFDFEGTPEKFISLIEEQNREEELKQLCQTVWLTIKDKSALGRKKRYE